ncbi:MAG TPA: ABC transporter permease [Ktedonobacterales bacterium]|nr:ABC transporter permease [Ktedonobacterales bacterium]
MSAVLLNSTQVTGRHLRAFLRQPWYVAITLVQPVIWLLLFGQLFKSVVEIPGFATASYIAFLTPGIVVMTALFSSGWSGMGYITDIDRGVMDRFLVTPVSRTAMIGGQLTFQAGMTVLQSLIILGLGFVAGARFPGGAASIAAFLLAVTLLGTTFAALSNTLALLLRKEESLIGAVNFLVLPLTFLSSTFMPAQLVPQWIRDVSRFNPVNWAVEVGRQTLNSSVDWSLVAGRGAALLALALVAGWISIRAYRAYQRSI